MSCGRNGVKANFCAVRNGVSAIGSKTAFYGAAAAAVAVSGAALLWQRVHKTQTPSRSYAVLATLSGQEKIFPVLPENISGLTCARCRSVGTAKKGSWYQIEGASYCQDCAPAQAAQAGAGLSATPAKLNPGLPELAPYWPRRATTLESITGSSGALRNLTGYAVLLGGKRSGLSLIPEVRTDPHKGQIRINQERWFVNYDLANKPLAGPFNKTQAQDAASLLCNFNWNRAVEDFSAVEVASVKAMLLDFRKKAG